jgi:hypothetical protein
MYKLNLKSNGVEKILKSNFKAVFGRSQRLLLLFICLLCLVFFVLPVMSGEYLHAWDIPLHIFFGTGYQNNWWSTVDERWYGGYSKMLYPPLAHQLVAIVASLLKDIALSQGLVLWLLLGIGPCAVYLFSRNFVDARSSIVAAMLFIFLPSIRSMTFVYGQFAGFTGLIFLLSSMGFLGKFLHNGKKNTALAACSLLACMSATHHNTTIFFMPVVLCIVFFTHLLRHKSDFRTLFLRFLWISFFFILSIGIVVFPFWLSLWDFQIQVPIPHPSRLDFFKNLHVFRVFFLNIYEYSLLFVPLILVRVFQKPLYVPLFTGFVIFMILGIGGTTPLPALLYGDKWQWLTFERFGVWATILLLPLVGDLIVQFGNRKVFYTGTLIAGLLVTSHAIWLIKPEEYRITPSPIEMSPIIQSFTQYPLCAERYLALGFSYQLPDFSSYSGAKTLDGLWHTAREDTFLRQSGIGALSNALYWDNGAHVLKDFLRREEPASAYCIYINEKDPESDKYRSIIKKENWNIRSRISSEVTLWTNDGVLPQGIFSPNTDVSQSKPIMVYGYLWGTLPLGCLGLAVLAVLSEIFRDGE